MARTNHNGLLRIAPLMLVLLLSTPVFSQVENSATESTDSRAADGQETSGMFTQDSEALDVSQKQSNPRIIVHENLQELPQVQAVGSEAGAEKVATDAEQEPQQAADHAPLPPGEKALVKTAEFVDKTRRPLIYVQENVPFFAKRNIIFFARLEPEVAWYSDGVLEDDSGFQIRRFRLGLAGTVKFWNGWNYKLEVDLTDGESSLSDAYLSYRTEKWGTLRIGNQRVAQTLSGQTSTLSTPFMERPLPILAFSLNRRLGIGWDTHLKRLGANITVFSRNVNEDIGAFGYAARFYFNPRRTRADVLHIGASWMNLESDDDAQYRARPESNLTDIRLVDTGVRPNVDRQQALGVELAGARGPLSLRSEFYRASWSQEQLESPSFNGWYVETSWFLTGETPNYRDGKFIRPNIQSDRGGWELAFRYSTIDLTDGPVRGGDESNLSFGVNWYSRIHWRIMANLIKVNSDGPFGKQDPWIVQSRIQYFF